MTEKASAKGREKSRFESKTHFKDTFPNSRRNLRRANKVHLFATINNATEKITWKTTLFSSLRVGEKGFISCQWSWVAQHSLHSFHVNVIRSKEVSAVLWRHLVKMKKVCFKDSVWSTFCLRTSRIVATKYESFQWNLPPSTSELFTQFVI